MRRITTLQIVAFNTLVLPAVALGCLVAWLAFRLLPPGDFRGLATVAIALVSTYAWIVVAYRSFLYFCPLRVGEIAPASSQEFVYHVYVLFYLVFFYPVMRSGLAPAPLMRLFYLALGTRLGENTFSQGIIHDPPFVTIGRDSTVGQSALLIPHVIEGERLAHYPIRIGNDVTVGAAAIVLTDVEVGDGAVIAAGAVVAKGSRIRPGETWGGVPARRIATAQKKQGA